MTTHHLKLNLQDETATERLAQKLASTILQDHASAPVQSDQAAAVIHLSGDLGAGKTTFARAFLRQCGVTGRIKSPTFALLEAYNVSSLNFYHIDFYRFSDPREWADAGFRDLFQPDSVVLIEWPEKADGTLPTADVLIQLDDHDPGRIAVLEARTPRGTRWLNKLQTNP
ncbi:tRNA (adenosine(37)-N6)-threonylcarbamoyltransferase complex ATPase subunit type 1 TsaE [Orrella marina]|uniref:tRNA threonylcarbamoyladenosine biosynthesis protein TsaE n=1 Tax=Orrella marina TaxID=2163011 RepID=A0A2R4XNA4_9BURK|nr:tRNA (adenosine(37)-N6)-threonylcarbamoyltransferase complex ATPase subunit type 1 TsaE [Orrella marina]AWB35292.1 tRNA (adenosine(37)-N6)-threonylcarbamoyltransferase complex ATPase subunit type 1 TsaE [Orrella marina]